MHRLTRTFVTALAAVTALGLAACSSASTESGSSTTSPTTSASTPAPSESGASSQAAGQSAGQSPSQASGGASVSGSAAPQTGTLGGGSVDTMYGTVTVPAKADLKVVALGWSDAEMALALGVRPIAVEDWQGFGAANKGVGPWATSLFGEVTPTLITRSDQTLNYEQLQALAPDVILNTRSSGDEKEYQRLSQIAPTIDPPKGTAAFATAWDVQLQQVADALGRSAQGKALIAQTKDKVSAAAAAHPEFKNKTIVSAAKFGDAYGAYLAGDGRFDLLADLGFVQNPPVAKLPTTGFYAAVSAEQVTALDADVTVITPIGFTKAQTEADPLIKSLKSVKDGRAIIVDPDSELSGAYSAASVLSIPVVIDQLVPQLATAVGKVS